MFQLSISCNHSSDSNLVFTYKPVTSITCKLDRMNLDLFNLNVTWLELAAGLPGAHFFRQNWAFFVAEGTFFCLQVRFRQTYFACRKYEKYSFVKVQIMSKVIHLYENTIKLSQGQISTYSHASNGTQLHKWCAIAVTAPSVSHTHTVPLCPPASLIQWVIFMK